MHNALRLEKLAGLSLVLALHACLLYGAWSSQLIPPPKEAVTLFVNLINPPPKKEKPLPEPPKPAPHKKVVLDKPRPIERPKPVPMLVAQTPVISEAEFAAPIPEPVPVLEPTPATLESAPVQNESSKPASPLMMSSELSLVCPHRTTPDYPAVSRRMGESGRVVLRVELDEAGQITTIKIKESSGYKRLDEAGLATVKTWQCHAAMRGGEAVRAVALQPFDFVLN